MPLSAELRAVVELLQNLEAGPPAHGALWHQNLLVFRDGTARSVAETATLQAQPMVYAAPEVRKGEPTTTAADIYSVGVMFLEALVGKPLDEPLVARLRDGAARQSPFWSALVKDPLTVIGARAVTADPAQRWSSPGEMAYAIIHCGGSRVGTKEELGSVVSQAMERQSARVTPVAGLVPETPGALDSLIPASLGRTPLPVGAELFRWAPNSSLPQPPPLDWRVDVSSRPPNSGSPALSLPPSVVELTPQRSRHVLSMLLLLGLSVGLGAVLWAIRQSNENPVAVSAEPSAPSVKAPPAAPSLPIPPTLEASDIPPEPLVESAPKPPPVHTAASIHDSPPNVAAEVGAATSAVETRPRPRIGKPKKATPRFDPEGI